ncbi:hypothetical protein C8J57DRAFT_1481541, partial [Mycena rebaudengoi]
METSWGTERSESDLVEMADAALLDVALDYRDCGLLVQPCPLKQVEDVMHVGVAEAVERGGEEDPGRDAHAPSGTQTQPRC